MRKSYAVNDDLLKIMAVGFILMETYKLIVELLGKVQHETILHKTIEALANYYEVLPNWVSSEPEQEGFESEIFEVFDDHNH